MTSIAKLKDKARKHEQQENWQAAIQVYRRVLDQQDESENLDLDLGLYNRIGDLNLRLGHTDEAVTYYEKAADKYAESGFYNNAIALCNKALRHRPNRTSVYLKLGRLCTVQGFQTDARRWILKYAERKVAAGEIEEALTGLEEFAELSDDPEIRETLARQLASHDRGEEAIDQLRRAYAMRLRADQPDKMAAVAEQARQIDPDVDLAAEEPVALPERESEGEDAYAAAVTPAEEPAEDEEVEGAGVADRLEPTVAEVGEATETDGVEGLETGAGVAGETEAGAVDELEGLEPTAEEGELAGEAGEEEVSGLEVGYGEDEPVETDPDAIGGLETFDREEVAAPEEEAGEPPPVEGSQDFESEEEAEPLPLLDTGYGDEPVDEEIVEEEVIEAEAVEEGVIQAEAVEEEAVEEEAVEAEAVGAEPVDEDAVGTEPTAEPVEEGELDLSFEAGERLGSVYQTVAEPMEMDVEGAFDLDEIDLGFGTGDSEAGEGALEDLDIDATLDRARSLVSRALTDQALRELNLLVAADAGPAVFVDALAVVNEILRHNPNDREALLRRVEYAERIGDTALEVDMLLDLAEALERSGASDKAEAVYRRTLEMDPSNVAAREALGMEAPAESDEGGDGESHEEGGDLKAAVQEMAPEALREGLEEADETDPEFTAMLEQFRTKVAENVTPEDAGDHYDLGLAFKEMGLIDEAIAEFQTALAGGAERLKVLEELGQCFVQKGQHTVAAKVFERALELPDAEAPDLLGVYYHLGRCYEALERPGDARVIYEEVLAIDDGFADVADRLRRL